MKSENGTAVLFTCLDAKHFMKNLSENIQKTKKHPIIWMILSHDK